MQQTVAAPVARDQLIGVRAMAQLTGQNASTVSRYLQRHPELSATVDGQTKVWRDAYLAHKSDNPVADAPPPVEVEIVPAAQPVVEARPAREARARHEEVRAELAELDLAERRGELVRVSEIHTAIASAAQELRDVLLTADVEFGERVKAAETPMAAAALIVERNREALNACLAALMGKPA